VLTLSGGAGCESGLGQSQGQAAFADRLADQERPAGFRVSLAVPASVTKNKPATRQLRMFSCLLRIEASRAVSGVGRVSVPGPLPGLFRP
jgi:hypothetical protein